MFVIEIPYMNLQQIYDTKQVPRWIKLKENKFVVIHKNKALKIEQNKQRFIMNCSEEEFFKIWFNYFDLKTDYKECNDQIKRLGKKFKIVANRGKGIHIVEQDPFESFIYSFAVKHFGYEKASKAINHIAEICGTKHVQAMREAGRVVWYEFPTPEMIIANYGNLNRMGTLNIWLKSFCEVIIKRKFDFVGKSEIELFRLLCLHEFDKFPLNGIKEVLERNFECEAEDFADIYLNKIENKGMAYMYILHHVLNPSKEMLYYGSY